MPKGSVRPRLELIWLTYHRLAEVAIDLRETGGIGIGFGRLVRIALSEEEGETYQADFSCLKEIGYHEAWWLEAADIKALFPDTTQAAKGGLSIPVYQDKNFPTGRGNKPPLQNRESQIN